MPATRLAARLRPRPPPWPRLGALDGRGHGGVRHLPAGSLAALPSVAGGLAASSPFVRSQRGYHVAIIGSGPSAFYTAKYLFKQAEAAEKAGKGKSHVGIDMFERLPTPFGLVRFGVAPDHPEVKNVIKDFAEVAKTPGFRFFGNVQIGVHASLGDLRRHYDAVVVCTGAEGERHLGIPGEGLDGVVGAPAFVKWYNSHPDYAHLAPPEPGVAACVVGQGNVALDVARVLVRSSQDLQPTDIDPRALARIAEWQRKGLQTVHIVGRRGFVQAAFTNKELRELDSFDGVLPIVDPVEMALCRNPASEEELSKSRIKKRSLEILDRMAANFAERKATSKRILWLRFLRGPSAVLADASGASVAGIRLDRTELQGEAGKQVAVRASSGETEDLPCGLVVRSVGFEVVPLEGLPVNSRGRVPHAQGRVEGAGGGAGGLYVAGWIKRGPTGIIASNIADAQESAACVFSDLLAGGPDSRADPAAVEAVIRSSGTRVVSFADWQKIEAEELRRGQAEGRAAVKLTDVGEMLALLGPSA